ncbi:hypothetical protein HF209_30615 [Pseudomonas sp. WS 5096]|uniref:Uncharacterized protein n=1 Tax=Pseudomonas cremoris TaxID=2724178 RepID=A0ABR6TH55_9PSED|nr:hypothetical protein [Pseudomonas cremoris]MBC2385311.1 hypothetical protein [Pseudomonas cremoris]
MKTIVGLFWAVIGGLFLACGVIVFTQLIGAGADLLGFTKWTFRYYVLCLGVCTAMLIMSKSARKYWYFMGGFFVAAVMVMGIGFHAFIAEGSGQGPVAQMQANVLSMALMAAKAVMYAAPGGLTAFYAFVAYDSVSKAPLKAPY